MEKDGTKVRSRPSIEDDHDENRKARTLNPFCRLVAAPFLRITDYELRFTDVASIDLPPRIQGFSARTFSS
jgi:hypothetical protein